MTPRSARVLLALSCVLAGCGLAHPGQLSYRVDTRLHFLTPAGRTLVAAPLTVRWAMRDFTLASAGSRPPSEGAGYFLVFVDRAPVRPGETARSLAAGDQRCLHRPGCPDEPYLEARGVYTTTSPSVTLPFIPPLSSNRERVQYHAITVVLMDTTGHRIGESAWELDVRLRRPGL